MPAVASSHIDESTVTGFQSGLRGQLLGPGDDTYEEVRPIYNAMVDKQPAFIARCADVADVMDAVNFARDNYERLATIKSKYDPDNLCSVNQNIWPKA